MIKARKIGNGTTDYTMTAYNFVWQGLACKITLLCDNINFKHETNSESHINTEITVKAKVQLVNNTCAYQFVDFTLNCYI